MHKSPTALVCFVALAVVPADAFAAARTAKAPKAIEQRIVTTETVTGPSVKCHQWGFMQVRLKVVKTEVGHPPGKPAVSIRITAVSWPVYPDHTPKSKYINAQALPLLQLETLKLQAKSGADMPQISGATNTWTSWKQSLQAALLEAEKP